MYIRRKVYSVLTDDYGYERLFSTNDVLLDGYDERYFSDDYASGRDTGALLGGALGLGAAGAGAYYGAGKYRKIMEESDKAEAKRIKELKKQIRDIGTGAEKNKALVEKVRALDTDLRKIGEGMVKRDAKNNVIKWGAAERAAYDEAVKTKYNQTLRELQEAGYNDADSMLKKYRDVLKKYRKMDKFAQTPEAFKNASDSAVKDILAELGENNPKKIKELEKAIKQPGAKRELLSAFRKLPTWGKYAAAGGGALAAAYGASKLGGAIGGAANKR